MNHEITAAGGSKSSGERRSSIPSRTVETPDSAQGKNTAPSGSYGVEASSAPENTGKIVGGVMGGAAIGFAFGGLAGSLVGAVVGGIAGTAARDS